MRINLTDNNIGMQDGGTFLRRDVSALFPIADKTIAELCRENKNLLIFPYSIESADDKIGGAPILNIQNTNDPERVRINTGNVMGFIGVDSLQIKIKSRFDNGRDDFLIHYMLQKVLSFNLFDLNHNSEQDEVFDFVMFMFSYFLKSALRQGIYRDYQNYKHNDICLKGPVDVSRHLSRNFPFRGDVAYSTREYSYDNSMTELIRHTIEFMKTKRYGQAVLNIDSETAQNVDTIIAHTPAYNKNNRSSVISKNLRMKIHPYYTEYRPLQTLCLQILRMDEIKYGETGEEICGILFDGAWLWEEYVNTLLCDYGFVHPQNRQRTGGIYLFNDNGIDSGIRYPDFYKDDFVLDAKYKKIGSYKKVAKVAPDDIHQVMAYMVTLHAERGGFVVPLDHTQEEIPSSTLQDGHSKLSIFGIEVAMKASTYKEFSEKMKENEATFIKSLSL